jgi:hypothetical protein
VILHKTIYPSYVLESGQRNDPPKSYVTYFRRDPSESKFKPDPITWESGGPGYPATDDRNNVVSWSGMSTLPTHPPAKSLVDPVQFGKHPQKPWPIYFWPGSMANGAHVYALIEQAGGDGAYMAAFRTEVVRVPVTFQPPT